MDSVGIPWNSDIPVRIRRILPELMGESKDLGIQQNGIFQPFRWILDGISWNSNIPVGVCWILLKLMGEGNTSGYHYL